MNAKIRTTIAVAALALSVTATSGTALGAARHHGKLGAKAHAHRAYRHVEPIAATQAQTSDDPASEDHTMPAAAIRNGDDLVTHLPEGIAIAMDGGATGDGPADDDECQRYADAINEAMADLREDLDNVASLPTISDDLDQIDYLTNDGEDRGCFFIERRGPSGGTIFHPPSIGDGVSAQIVDSGSTGDGTASDEDCEAFADQIATAEWRQFVGETYDSPAMADQAVQDQKDLEKEGTDQGCFFVYE